jgi:hypothetical protein
VGVAQHAAPVALHIEPTVSVLLVPSALPQSRLPALALWPLEALPEPLPEDPLPLDAVSPPLADDPLALPLLALPLLELPLLELALLIPLDPPAPELPPPFPPSPELAGWFDEQFARATLTATHATRITQCLDFITFSPVPERRSAAVQAILFPNR